LRLRVKLLFVHGLLILGSATVALIVIETFARRELQHSAESRLREVADLLAEQGDQYVSDELEKLKSWARMPLVVQTALDKNNAMLVDNFEEYFSEIVKRERRYSLYLLNCSGDCIACDDRRRLHSKYARDVIFKLPDAQKAYDGKSSIGISVFSTATARPVVPITAPVMHEGKVVGILRSTADMGLLHERLFNSLRIGKSGRVFVDMPELDKNLPEGHELLVPDMYPRWISPPKPVVLAMEKAPEGVFYYSGVHRSQIVVSSRMSNPPWLVSATQPMDEVLAPLKKLRLVTMLVFAVMVVLLIGAIFGLVAPAVRGIELCRSMVVQFRQGRLDKRIPVQGSDEIGDLSSALNEMAASLDKGRKDLAAAEQKYRGIFESAVEGIFQTTSEGLLLTANAAMARILDLSSPEECVGKSVLSHYGDPARRRELLDVLKTNGMVENFEIELVSLTGIYKFCELSAKVEFDGKGEISMLQGIMLDVTERRQASAAREHVRETERLLAEARWNTLRQQMNPHFLFNALNSIKALLIVNSSDAGEMIERLATFCRATLAESEDGLASVEEEVEVVKQYLWIEQMRWKDTLQVEWNIDAGVKKTRVPAFTLQPLVENAVKYGQLSGSRPLVIRISVRMQDEGKLLIEVTNTGRWFKPEERTEATTGVGLENLRNRYMYFCGSEVIIETLELDGFVAVRIVIPARICND